MILYTQHNCRSMWFDSESQLLKIIDQTKLPFAFEILSLNTLEDVCNAISFMQVRGAPLIGAAAAYGMYFSVLKDPNLQNINYTS